MTVIKYQFVIESKLLKLLLWLKSVSALTGKYARTRNTNALLQTNVCKNDTWQNIWTLVSDALVQMLINTVSLIGAMGHTWVFLFSTLISDALTSGLNAVTGKLEPLVTRNFPGIFTECVTHRSLNSVMSRDFGVAPCTTLPTVLARHGG